MTTTPKALPAEVSVDDDVKALEDALALKPTPGPYKVVAEQIPHKLGGKHHERRIFTEWIHPQLKSGSPVVNRSVGLGEKEGDPAIHMVSMSEADACWLAAADPDRIHRILSALAYSRSTAPIADSLASAGGVPWVSMRECGSHHYTPENIAAIVADLKAVEKGVEQPEWVNRDHRTSCGILWRVISALAHDVPLNADAAGGVEVVAYLVSGGRIFKDQAVTHKDSARTRIAERKDGSVAHPLVKQSDHLAALTKEREVADGLAEALRAYQEAEAMSVYGDYSGFVWGKQTMRSEGNHAYGYICDRHGLGYTSSCVCCRDEYERYENQQDLKARIARDEAFRRARLAAGHALAALAAHRESRGAASEAKEG